MENKNMTNQKQKPSERIYELAEKNSEMRGTPKGIQIYDFIPALVQYLDEQAEKKDKHD